MRSYRYISLNLSTLSNYNSSSMILILRLKFFKMKSFLLDIKNAIYQKFIFVFSDKNIEYMRKRRENNCMSQISEHIDTQYGKYRWTGKMSNDLSHTIIYRLRQALHSSFNVRSMEMKIATRTSMLVHLRCKTLVHLRCTLK